MTKTFPSSILRWIPRGESSPDMTNCARNMGSLLNTKFDKTVPNYVHQPYWNVSQRKRRQTQPTSCARNIRTLLKNDRSLARSQDATFPFTRGQTHVDRAWNKKHKNRRENNEIKNIKWKHTKTLPKALRTQELTAFTSNFGLVGLI